MKKPLLFAALLASQLAFSQASTDVCSSNTIITVGSSCTPVTGNLFNATEGGASSTCGRRYDMWYRFTVPANSNMVRIQVTLPATSVGLSTSNTYVEVFNTSVCGSVAAGVSLGCNTISSPRFYSGLTEGATYYMRVFTTGNPNTSPSSRYDFSLCITSNDNCNTATTLTPNTDLVYSVQGALGSVGTTPTGCATGTSDDDVWFKFVPGSPVANIVLSNLGSNLNTSGIRYQLLKGDCGSLTVVDCGSGTGTFPHLNLTPGDTYYIRVYSNGSSALTSNANFTINLNHIAGSVGSSRMNEVFKQVNLSPPSLLKDPWEVTYGSDGMLWVTESKGYRLFRINPSTGVRTTVLDLSQGSTFFSTPSDQAFNMQFDIGTYNPQGGFAGLAIHPKFLDPVTPKNFVYVSYVHEYLSTAPSNGGTFYKNRIVRFTYNTSTGLLESPVSLCDTIPGSNDHNSQRMIIAPVGGTDYLFYAAGDMGAGQFSNRFRPMHAQDPNYYEGKILRFNLESDGDAGAYAQWLPNDNPYGQSAVWCIGIRNNQGFAYDKDKNILYGSSHGPYSDDEINVIERAKNYGHPIVIGYASDGNYDGASAGTNNTTSSCPDIVSESANAASIGTSYKDPLFSAYAVSKASIQAIWKTNSPPGNGSWPSEGWSGLDLYKNSMIPGWKNSLIVSSLKWGRLLRLKIGSDGNSILPIGGYDTISYFGSTNRFRDLAVSPDGRDIFVIMDRSGTTSGPSAANPIVPGCAGCLTKYTFLGYRDQSNKSTIPTYVDVSDPGTNNTCVPVNSAIIDDDNNNLWVPITGPDGNVVAEIKANGQNLGVVTASVYKNNGALRQHLGKRYMDRNLTITPAVQPTNPVNIRLYISNAEIAAMTGDPLSSISNVNQLKILKNQDACRGTVGSNTTLIDPDYIEAHGTGGYVIGGTISSFSSFYFGAALITLPLDLLTFKGTLVDNATLLEWETANEKNTDQFIVERSIDGRNFTAIGTVAAAGNSSANVKYNYTDAAVTTLPSNVIYYRLKMMNQDGSFSYTTVVKITLTELAGRLSVYPNPASNVANVSFNAGKAGTASWKLINKSGATVLQGSVNLKAGKNLIPLNIQHLAAGTYHFIFTGTDINKNINIQKL